MNGTDDSERGLGGDDAVAAEYVLGTLDADERQAAARRLDADAAFARLVDRWEVILSPMADRYGSVEAPASAKQAIDRRLFASTASQPVQKAGLWSSLAFWRGLAVAAVAAAAIAIAVPLMTPPAPPAHMMVASLAPQQSDVHYLVVYDGTKGEIGLSHVSGERASGRDFELWVIEGNQQPRSLGVIPVGARMTMPVSPEMKDKVAAGAVFAISLEPRGGSTTGAPTGPVVAAGNLRDI